MSAHIEGGPDLRGLRLYVDACRAEGSSKRADYLHVLLAEAYNEIGIAMAKRLRRRAQELRESRPMTTGSTCRSDFYALCLVWREITEDVWTCERQLSEIERRWPELRKDFDAFINALADGQGSDADPVTSAWQWAEARVEEMDRDHWGRGAPSVSDDEAGGL